MTWIPLCLIFIPIILSILIYIINNTKFNLSVFFVQLLMTIGVGYLCLNTPINGDFRIRLGNWNPQYGVELKFDALSLIFMLMTIIIWWVILIYSWNHKKSDHKFLFFLMFLEGTYIAFLQTNDIFTFFVLLEIVTIISAILILYKKDGYSLKAGLYYLLFNSMGMALYLIGIFLLYISTGSLNMDIVKTAIECCTHNPMINISYATVMVAMCVKSAMFPVYGWLPRAHSAAPASISALLSGLLVKSGIYGILTYRQIFAISDFNQLLFFLGCFTAITGVIFAICQKDIKHILAYHTISQVGLIVVGISSEPIVGFYGGMAHLFNHFLFKGLLFLGAGIIINEYGVRKIPDIKGLGKSHPFLTLFMFIGILSISGAPFFNGYVSKNMLKLGVAGNYGQWILPIVNFGTILSFVKFSTIFFGKPITKTKLKKNQVFALGIMAVLCLASAIVELRLFSLSEVLPYKYAKLFTLSSASHYVVSVCIAVLAYKFIISKDVKPMKKIRRFYVSFPNANMFLLGFLILVLFYLNRATIVPIF